MLPENSTAEPREVQRALQLSFQQHVATSTVIDRLMSEWILEDENGDLEKQASRVSIAVYQVVSYRS
jgi:hypothetical protein